jgi:hypothetical protein
VLGAKPGPATGDRGPAGVRGAERDSYQPSAANTPLRRQDQPTRGEDRGQRAGAHRQRATVSTSMRPQASLGIWPARYTATRQPSAASRSERKAGRLAGRPSTTRSSQTGFAVGGHQRGPTTWCWLATRWRASIECCTPAQTTNLPPQPPLWLAAGKGARSSARRRVRAKGRRRALRPSSQALGPSVGQVEQAPQGGEMALELVVLAVGWTRTGRCRWRLPGRDRLRAGPGVRQHPRDLAAGRPGHPLAARGVLWLDPDGHLYEVMTGAA